MIHRRLALLILSATAILLTACGERAGNDRGNDASAAGFPPVTAPYTAERAAANSDVVNIHGKYRNLDRWKAFLSSVDAGRPDSVRITQYTIEGDPIFFELVYDGRSVAYTFDNAMDAYGANQGRPSTVCAGLGTETVGSGDGYVLTDCDDPKTGRTFWFAAPA